jgi:hypothetical protein
MIETLDDWNYYLTACCGCPMPDFDGPVWVCESIEVDLSRCAVSPPDGTTSTPCAVKQGWFREVYDEFREERVPFGVGERTRRETRTLSGVTCEIDIDETDNGVTIPTGGGAVTITRTEGPIFGGGYFFQEGQVWTSGYSSTSKRSYLSPVADPLAELLDQSAPLAAAAWADPEFGSGSLVIERNNICETETTITEATSCTPSLPIRLRSLWLRYRPEPPETHPGLWYKVTWDIEEVPLVGPTILIEEGNTWEFSRPDVETDWPEADWFYIEPSPVPGTIRRRANIVFAGYRSPYGTPVKPA